ncbi:MAG: sigma 54-interacting transcriptional regulator [Peptococcaceae bacterium]|nr:sigma 54-interacting transcriptional regulator [Peptococcaceae bacterium]
MDRSDPDQALLQILVQELLQHLTEGIHVADCDGRTLFYNHIAGRLDGIRPEEALGQHVLKLFPSLNPETSTILLALQGRQPAGKQVQCITNMYGSKVYLESTTIALKQGDKIVGAVDISRDVTQVKELTEKVVDLQSELLTRRSNDRRLGQAEQAHFAVNDILGQDAKIAALRHKILRVARTSSPVLVYGETGTGKELLVQSIHTASPRCQGPFVSQNCAALPAALMEGILFGTVKGCFTGAENRAGLLEAADGGTLLLDEITCLDIDLQAKLLRFMQDGFVRRLGDDRIRRVNVRIIASTNIEPQSAVNKRVLRADLYYRLNVVALELPPLRERGRDILDLAEHFIREFNVSLNLNVKGLSREVEQIFLKYGWPGNVRELRAVIEGVMNTLDGEVLTAQNLPPYLYNANESPLDICQVENMPLQAALAVVQKALIGRAMQKAQGNVAQAARLLGIPRQTLQYKLKAELPNNQYNAEI